MSHLAPWRRAVTSAVALVVTLAAASCGGDGGSDTATGSGGTTGGDGDGAELVVYAGRNENLIRPLLERFEKASGIDLQVRYGETSEMLGTIIEEGDASRADVFISQDAGALAQLASSGALAPLPETLTALVDERFRDPQHRWVGVTGRVRVLSYNTAKVTEAELPQSVFDLTEPSWKGRVGLAPTNASFIAFVSALRESVGEDKVAAWLKGLADNDVETFDNNVQAVEGVANGTVDVALVNHYYLYSNFKEKGRDIPVANFHTGQGDGGEGTFVNVSGVGVMARSTATDAAQRLVEFLLGEEAQTFFREETSEYPLREGVEPVAELPALSTLKTMAVPLSDLGADYAATVELIKAAGLS